MQHSLSAGATASDGCLALRATAHNGMGNQLLYATAAGILAEFSGLRKCAVRLSDDPDDPNSRELLSVFNRSGFDLDAAIRPCRAIGPSEAWPDGAIANLTFGYDDAARWGDPGGLKLSRQSTLAGCAANTALELDGHYNFCRVMGLVRFDEMQDAEVWASLFERVPRMLRKSGYAAALAARSGIDNGTLCVQVRGRMTEETGEPIANNSAVRALLETAGEVAERQGARSLFVASRYDIDELLPARLRSLRRLRLPDAASNSPRVALLAGVRGPYEPPTASHESRDLRADLGEAVALSRCPTLLLEESPIRCTFCLVAQLLGGLSACPKSLTGRVDYPWRALCRPTTPAAGPSALYRSNRCLFDDVGDYPCADASSGAHCVQQPQSDASAS